MKKVSLQFLFLPIPLFIHPLPSPKIPIFYWANPYTIVALTAMALRRPLDTWTLKWHLAAKHNHRRGLIQRKYLKLL